MTMFVLVESENIETMKKMILDYRRTTIREVADDVGIAFGSCQEIFMDVLKKLQNFEQTQRRTDITQEMLTMFNDDPDLLKKVITDDKLWVCGYDI